MFLSCSCGRKHWSLYAYFLNANNRFEHCSSTPMNRMSDKQYLSPPPNLSGFISFCFYYFPTSAPNLLSFFPFSVFNSFAGIMQGLCHRLIAYLDTSKDFFPFFFNSPSSKFMQISLSFPSTSKVFRPAPQPKRSVTCETTISTLTLHVSGLVRKGFKLLPNRHDRGCPVLHQMLEALRFFRKAKRLVTATYDSCCSEAFWCSPLNIILTSPVLIYECFRNISTKKYSLFLGLSHPLFKNPKQNLKIF